MKIMVTGGNGFIGSNFISFLLHLETNIQIINIDNCTYAGKGNNIGHMQLNALQNYKSIKADIQNMELMDYVVKTENPEMIFNFAAESHVDRSIESSDSFERTNFLGACTLFKVVMKYKIKKIIHISTDEVYGSISGGSFDESSALHPSNPYAVTKAAADLMAQTFFTSFHFPVIVTRSANNYGPYQFPEKLLPLFITNLIDNKKVPLMYTDENPGLNVRDWLHVDDNCRAIWFVANKGKVGEVYNIGGENEKTNIEITRKLLKVFNLGEDMIEKVPHRKAHDFRYSITNDKLKNLGFTYLHLDLEEEIKNLVHWYKNNQDWWRPLKS